MHYTKKIGMLLLSIWLIVQGVMVIFHLSFEGIGIVMAILAIAAGIFLLIER